MRKKTPAQSEHSENQSLQRGNRQYEKGIVQSCFKGFFLERILTLTRFPAALQSASNDSMGILPQEKHLSSLLQIPPFSSSGSANFSLFSSFAVTSPHEEAFSSVRPKTTSDAKGTNIFSILLFIHSFSESLQQAKYPPFRNVYKTSISAVVTEGLFHRKTRKTPVGLLILTHFIMLLFLFYSSSSRKSCRA